MRRRKSRQNRHGRKPEDIRRAPARGHRCGQRRENAALAIIPAALLCNEPCTIENLPQVSDTFGAESILRELGAKVELNGSTMTIDPRGVNSTFVPEAHARRLRASYYFVGTLLACFGKAEEQYV